MAEPNRNAVVVFCTAPPDEAGEIADALVAARLAACVSIMPVRSRYRWQGETCVDEEHLMIIKTLHGRLDELIGMIRGIHSYEVPEILALPVVEGYPGYLEWMHQVIR
jgi:periplasmic divalent cation tolerance protein